MRHYSGRAAVDDDEEYRAARAAAGGGTVWPLKAVEVRPDMTVWHNGRWLTVLYRRLNGEAVVLDFTVPEPGGTAFRVVSPQVRMYRLEPGLVQAAQPAGVS